MVLFKVLKVLRFLLLSPKVVILQLPVLLRLLCVCLYVSSSGISLLLKKLLFPSTFGCHLSLAKRGRGKYMLRTLYMGCLQIVFCEKSSFCHQEMVEMSMSRSQRKADVKYVLAE